MTSSLTLLKNIGSKKSIYLCECGKEFIAYTDNVNRNKTKSCGCLTKYLISLKVIKHQKTNHKLYSVWANMKSRCYNKRNNRYKNYGGRGINICNEWKNSFISFYDWAIQNGYNDGLQIDRINNDGNYEPSNCQFISVKINTRKGVAIRSNNTSNYRGVCFRKERSKWISKIKVDGKVYSLGTFDNPRDAAIAYDTFVIVYGLEHTTNFPKGVFENVPKK